MCLRAGTAAQPRRGEPAQGLGAPRFLAVHGYFSRTADARANVAVGQGTVESLVMFSGAYQDKVVWLSGHTGFKGAWLAGWLLRLGARVHGFSLQAEGPVLFRQLGLESRLEHEIGDVRDLDAVKDSVARVQPDFVFHLAAQALVRLSYEHPLETYATN